MQKSTAYKKIDKKYNDILESLALIGYEIESSDTIGDARFIYLKADDEIIGIAIDKTKYSASIFMNRNNSSFKLLKRIEID